MPDYHIPLIPDAMYHIFSRAIGSEKLFREEENYRFFLKKYKLHILHVADTFAYALLPNHFHFLIRIKPEVDIEAQYNKLKSPKKCKPEDVSGFLMERFGNLLNSYTKAFNKQNNRKGGLFIDTMRRVEIKDDAQLSAIIFYIHKNAVHHGYAAAINQWSWCSYHSFLNNSATSLVRNEVLEWFAGRENFEQFHKQPVQLKYISWEME